MVWPAGSDSYSHTDLSANFDTLDGIIGGPSSGAAWPVTTGLDGGIFREIAFLQNERTPLGSLWYWWRPSTSMPLSTFTNYGWVVADGSTLTSGQHSFPGIVGSVTLPNLLDAFPLGADPNKAVGTAAVSVTDGNVNASAGAPGIGGTGGFNAQSLVIAQMPAHDHGGGNHAHTFNRQIIQFQTPSAPAYLINVRDQITHTETTNPSGNIINSQGSGSPIDNRPRYVGLLPIIKVKNVSAL